MEPGIAWKSFEFVEKMRLKGVLGNISTFMHRLKVCGTTGAADKGMRLHIEIAEFGLLEKYSIVGNALVDMYAKCGLMSQAHKVIVNYSIRDAIAWTALMTGYINHEMYNAALESFEQMQHEGISPNEVSFALGLKACGSAGTIDMGLKVHSEVVRRSSCTEKPIVGNALVDMYVKFGFLAKAHEVFDRLPFHDVISWTTIIAGYTSFKCGEEALVCLEQMNFEGVEPNPITIVCGLQACEIIGSIEKAQKMHAGILRKASVEMDTAVGNALINMYAKFSMFQNAWNVLYDLPSRDVIAWTALITGYVYHQCYQEALHCFVLMQSEMVTPNPITLISILKACSIGETMDKGLTIYSQMLKLEMVRGESAIGNTLVNMYGKCGLLKKAQELFDQLETKDVISWNALMSAYLAHDHAREALSCFEKMQFFHIFPDVVSFICGLKACCSLGLAKKGLELHAEVVRKGLLDREHIVGNALVDMYAKCGLHVAANEVFDSLSVRDPVSWTSLITVHTQLGLTQSVFSMFSSMLQEGIKPDPVTFTNVLKICSRICCVDEGQLLFDSISKGFGLAPTLEHFTCVMNLLGQAGRLYEAAELIKWMPFDADHAIMHTLLNLYQNFGEVNLGHRTILKATRQEDKDNVPFVHLASMYTDQSRRRSFYESDTDALCIFQ